MEENHYTLGQKIVAATSVVPAVVPCWSVSFALRSIIDFPSRYEWETEISGAKRYRGSDGKCAGAITR
jgi:hypothetical protein